MYAAIFNSLGLVFAFAMITTIVAWAKLERRKGEWQQHADNMDDDWRDWNLRRQIRARKIMRYSAIITFAAIYLKLALPSDISSPAGKDSFSNFYYGHMILACFVFLAAAIYHGARWVYTRYRLSQIGDYSQQDEWNYYNIRNAASRRDGQNYFFASLVFFLFVVLSPSEYKRTDRAERARAEQAAEMRRQMDEAGARRRAELDRERCYIPSHLTIEGARASARAAAQHISSIDVRGDYGAFLHSRAAQTSRDAQELRAMGKPPCW